MATGMLSANLDHLGLSQYLRILVEEAFSSWEALTCITEHDLNALGVKLGHRRILQSAVARHGHGESVTGVQYRGNITDSASKESYGRTDAPHPTPEHGNASLKACAPQKRKYIRHAAPDKNVPEKPPSAYGLFSQELRKDLKIQGLGSNQTSNITGKRWRLLSSEVRAAFLSRSRLMKSTYHIRLTEYQQTKECADYQDYLADFHKPPDDTKRLKNNEKSKFSTSAKNEMSSNPGGDGDAFMPPKIAKARVEWLRPTAVSVEHPH
ncbi:hypothetical protein WHR41_09332 [Cladosporium halotolerans]|uniref:HMG box domain-containing protein n=1 Tax=Cladosporium halotolerans TaxID=1052096 RepID=A0AB34KFF9_9PEZI